MTNVSNISNVYDMELLLAYVRADNAQRDKHAAARTPAPNLTTGIPPHRVVPPPAGAPVQAANAAESGGAAELTTPIPKHRAAGLAANAPQPASRASKARSAPRETPRTVPTPAASLTLVAPKPRGLSYELKGTRQKGNPPNSGDHALDKIFGEDQLLWVCLSSTDDEELVSNLHSETLNEDDIDKDKQGMLDGSLNTCHFIKQKAHSSPSHGTSIPQRFWLEFEQTLETVSLARQAVYNCLLSVSGSNLNEDDRTRAKGLEGVFLGLLQSQAGVPKQQAHKDGGKYSAMWPYAGKQSCNLYVYGRGKDNELVEIKITIPPNYVIFWSGDLMHAGGDYTEPNTRLFAHLGGWEPGHAVDFSGKDEWTLEEHCFQMDCDNLPHREQDYELVNAAHKTPLDCSNYICIDEANRSKRLKIGHELDRLRS